MTGAAAEVDERRDEESQPLLGDPSIDPVIDRAHVAGSETKQRLSQGHVFVKISFLLLGDFLANADDTIFTAIYERVASEFQNSDNAAWLVLAQSLVYAVCLPIYGYCGDRYNKKKIILTSYFLFICGCLLTSLLPSIWLVLLGRVVSCVGGTGLYSMTAIVIADNADPADVGLLRSYTVAAAFMGRNAGPIIGGLVADSFGWRRAFLCEVPVAIFCALVITWLFDAKKDTKQTDEEGAQEPVKPKNDSPMDFLGVFLFAVTMSAAVLALKSQNKFGPIPTSVVWLAIGLVFGAALIWRERSIGDRAFIPASILNRDLSAQYLIQILWITGAFGAVISIPVYLARVQHASTSSVALHLIPFAAMSTVSNIGNSLIIRRLKRYKYFIHIGALVGAAAYFLLAFFWNGPIGVGKSLLPAILGIGGGAINASTFMAVSVIGDENRKGAIIGLFFLAQEIGCLLGIAGSSNLLNSIYGSNLSSHAPDVPNKDEIITQILRDSRFAFTLPSVWRDLSVASFVKAWKVFGLVGAALALVLQPLLLTVVEKPFG